MAEIINTVADQLSQFAHYDRPGLAIGAAGAVAAGIYLDYRKQAANDDIEYNALPIADDDIAELNVALIKKAERRERVGHYLGVAVLSTTLLTLAGPYSTSSETNGSMTVILDGSYAANAADMQGISRLQASVDGTLAAANKNNVPFSIIIAGARATIADQMPAKAKDSQRTVDAIKNVIDGPDPSYRNGEALQDAINQAKGLTAEQDNKIVVVAANAADITASQLAVTGNNTTTDRYYAIATGNGASEYSVAGQKLVATTDPASFSKLVGKDKVTQARSTSDVQKQLDAIVDQQLTHHQKTPAKWPLQLALLSGLALGVSAIWERAAGITLRRNS